MSGGQSQTTQVTVDSVASTSIFAAACEALITVSTATVSVPVASCPSRT